MTRNITGNATVKKTDAGLRQKVFWSKRNWWSARAAPLTAAASSGAVGG